MPARKTKPRTPRPKDDEADEAGTEIEQREQTGILPSEAEVVRSLGIPVGFVEAKGEPGEIMAGILAEIAGASSIEEVLASGKTQGLAEFVGQNLVVDSFKYQPSEFDPEGWPFVVIRAADDDGLGHIITSGAKAVIATLALARKLDALPFKCSVSMAEFETGEGERRRAYKLVSAE